MPTGSGNTVADAVVGDAVQRFVPISIRRQAETRDGGGRSLSTLQLRHPFGQRHAADQIIDPFLKGCDGSRQIGGSVISGTRRASAEKLSANSEASKAITDAPAAVLISTVLNFAAPLLDEKTRLRAPGFRRLHAERARDSGHLPRATGGGKDVEILCQRDVAGHHIKHPFTGCACQGFHLADGDRVTARRQMTDRDIEIFPVDLLTKRRRIVGGGALYGHGRIVLAMNEFPVDAHIRAAGGADFVCRKHGGGGKSKPTISVAADVVSFE